MTKSVTTLIYICVYIHFVILITKTESVTVGCCSTLNKNIENTRLLDGRLHRQLCVQTAERTVERFLNSPKLNPKARSNFCSDQKLFNGHPVPKSFSTFPKRSTRCVPVGKRIGAAIQKITNAHTYTLVTVMTPQCLDSRVRDARVRPA